MRAPTPREIIAGIDSTAGEYTCTETTRPRRSPSRMIADAAMPRQNRPKPASGPGRLSMGTRPAGQGFWAIWVEHHEHLRRHSLRWMSNNADDADDALSNAMLVAQRKFPKYAHAITNTRYWLTRLVHNVCMDHHRAARRLQNVESETGWDEPVEHSVIPGRQTARQPDQEAIDEELLSSLQRGLRNLPASLHEPLILRCLYGLAYPDIAALMNLSECTARKRVQLARDKLGRWIGVS